MLEPGKVYHILTQRNDFIGEFKDDGFSSSWKRFVHVTFALPQFGQSKTGAVQMHMAQMPLAKEKWYEGEITINLDNVIACVPLDERGSLYSTYRTITGGLVVMPLRIVTPTES